MDEQHLHCALRYVALNPVRAGLVARAQDWPWSSASAQLGLDPDEVTDTAAVAERMPNFASLLAAAEDEQAIERLRRAESIGRPIGAPHFLDGLEQSYGRKLRTARRGPPRREEFSALSP